MGLDRELASDHVGVTDVFGLDEDGAHRLGDNLPRNLRDAESIGADGLAAAMPALLAALGERLPADPEGFTTPQVGAVEELIVRLSHPGC